MASKERLYELWMLYYTKVSHEQAIARASHSTPVGFGVYSVANLPLPFHIMSHPAYSKKASILAIIPCPFV